MNVFEAVKQSVTTRQAAEHFGIRVGRNGMCVCPFHADKNPSMKVDRRFHCFGCQADGDVIDFVSRLEAVSPKEAALMLAQAFSVPYEDKEPPRRRKPRQETPEQQFRRMERYCFRVLCDYRNLLRRWKLDYAPNTPDEDFHPLFVESLQKQDYVDYLLDVLLSPDMEERAALIIDCGYHRTGTAITDTDMNYLLLYLEETYGLTSEKKIAAAIGIVANENGYHPIRDYLNGLSWDGTERIRTCLHHFLGADSDQYTYEALRLFLLGAIHRAFHPGCKFEVMLCLVGGQGAGKSTFFRLLAVKDEWFSDDLRKLDDDNVYRKLQGHWIIEMSEMIATANAKSIEEIKSFLSRQKEVYKIPYETHPEDRLRQCVFGGTSNALDFLPLDRSGNRRFLPVMVYPEQAEVHILDDEAASRAYMEQLWAEAMTIYRSGDFKLSFSPEMVRYLKEHQRDFMPEDTKAGMIQAYLDRYTGSMVCSKQLFREALNHPFDEPKQWEIREVNDIMNHCVTGWHYFSNPRMFPEYGRQKGWERETPATDTSNGAEKIPEGFVEVTEQMELPF